MVVRVYHTRQFFFFIFVLFRTLRSTARILYLFDSLCAWALEQLRDCEEFAGWSNTALEPWYEMQLTLNRRADVPESTDEPGPGASLIYKSMHKLSHGDGSYVLSLFEQREGNGLTVRAFDRARLETLWLTLSKKQVLSLGGTATRTTARLAEALARRLRVKVDGATNAKRVVLPPLKTAEGGKKFSPKRGRHTNSANIPAAEITASPSSPPQQRPPMTAPPATAQESGAAQNTSGDDVPERRTSNSPSTRGTANDPQSMVESEVDIKGDSAEESIATEVLGAAVSSGGRVVGSLEMASGTEEQTVRTLVKCRAWWLHLYRPGCTIKSFT